MDPQEVGLIARTAAVSEGPKAKPFQRFDISLPQATMEQLWGRISAELKSNYWGLPWFYHGFPMVFP